MNIGLPDQITIGAAYVAMGACFGLFLLGATAAAMAAQMAHSRALTSRPVAGWVIAALVGGISGISMLIGFLVLFCNFLGKLTEQF